MKKSRKTISLLLTLCLMVSLVPIRTSAQELKEYQEGFFSYTITDGKATLTKYTGSEKDVVVPASLGGYPVYEIGSNAFYMLDNLESLTFSEGITNFAVESIMLCRFLKTIHYPSTAIIEHSSHIGFSSLPYKCFSLEQITVAEDNPEVVVVDNILYSRDMKMLLKVPEADPREVLEIPVGVEEIATSACTYNEHIKQVIMPDTVTFIGYWAFEYCNNLESLNISANCQTICQYAFEKTNLTTFHFPATLEFIMDGAFGYMGKETTITVAEGNPYYYAQDNVLFGRYAGGIRLIRYPSGSLVEEYTIPEGVTTISLAAYGGQNLKALHLPYSLIQIHDAAFVGYSDFVIYYPRNSKVWTEEVRAQYPFFVTWEAEDVPHEHVLEVLSPIEPGCYTAGRTEMQVCGLCGLVAAGQTIPTIGHHTFPSDQEHICTLCGEYRTVAMFRMYDPNSGEHFYTGSEEERENLVNAGWNYEGIGFNFPIVGNPVYRLYDPVTGEHLYTRDDAEKQSLLDFGWNYEGIAFNSATEDEVAQYRLHNPNEIRGAYHFTGSEEERDNLIAAGWEYQGIGWYSTWH